MARDRQRAKKRRARGGTPVPNPLAHSSAEVDEARLAEAGIPIGEEGVAPAPDKVEGDLVPSKFEQVEVEDEGQREEERKATFLRRTIIFLGHVIDELRRVQWPTRQQTIQGTMVTLGFVIIAGSYLGLLDAIWKPIVERII